MLMKRGIALLALLIPAIAQAQVAGTPPNGRLLASNCFQCHGTNGQAVSGFEKLAGMSAAELKEEMAEMKLEGKGGIMGAHAAAYTDAQIGAMATYFASVGRNSNTSQSSTVRRESGNKDRSEKADEKADEKEHSERSSSRNRFESSRHD